MLCTIRSRSCESKCCIDMQMNVAVAVVRGVTFNLFAHNMKFCGSFRRQFTRSTFAQSMACMSFEVCYTTTDCAVILIPVLSSAPSGCDSRCSVTYTAICISYTTALKCIWMIYALTVPVGVVWCNTAIWSGNLIAKKHIQYKPQSQHRLDIRKWNALENCIRIILYIESLIGKNVQPAVYVDLVLTIACKQVKDFVREYFLLCLLAPAFMSPWSSKGATGTRDYACIRMYINMHVCMYVCTLAHILHFIDLMQCLFAHCSQLSSPSPWSSKGDTVQISSPSSVHTVIVSLTQAGCTMGHWRAVNS